MPDCIKIENRISRFKIVLKRWLLDRNEPDEPEVPDLVQVPRQLNRPPHIPQGVPVPVYRAPPGPQITTPLPGPPVPGPLVPGPPTGPPGPPGPGPHSAAPTQGSDAPPMAAPALGSAAPVQQYH